MPSISEFFGITIYMYHAHGQHKAAYFHARYQGGDASFLIETSQILAGNLPPKVVKLIQEWAIKHKVELVDNWQKVLKNELPNYIQGADHD
jgi:3-methyladenine DNA glycosylase Mpg